jgi:ComF family protein
LLIKTVSPDAAPSLVRKFCISLFSLVFPDDCRICTEPLRQVSRIPVCRECLGKLDPLAADYFCAQCRAPFRNAFPLDEQGLCALCRRGVSGFDAAYSYGFYEGELRELIHLFKYGRIQTLAKPLGRLLALALPREESFDAIVPMPLHWRKRWQRGFNQADLLAHEVSRRTHTPVHNALRRVRFTSTQAGLTNAKRRANVSGAFRPKRATTLRGQRVLLVDDVMTTGSTAAACARALKMAGARHVVLLTVARTDRRVGFDLQLSDSKYFGSTEHAKS